MRRTLVLLLFATLMGLQVLPALAAGERAFYVPTKAGRRACIEGALFLRVPVPKKGAVSSMAKRYTGSAENWGDILKATGFSPKSKKRPAEVRIPLDLLQPTYRDEVLTALFPKDERGGEGWLHSWDGSPMGARENWTDLARWFAGSPKRATEIQKANPKAGARPKAGTVILVPEGLLADAIAEIEPPAQLASKTAPQPSRPQTNPSPQQAPLDQVAVSEIVPPETAGPPKPVAQAPPRPESSPPVPGGQGPPAMTSPQAADLSSSPSLQPLVSPVSPLTYAKDGQGDYAIYHLQAGEALYSAVVVRFTGTLGADDVNALARDIAKRSAILDVTSIPVGYPVKIPIEDLLPQFLPPTSPQYQAWAKNRSELGKVTNTYKSAGLEGVVVILDPGHGGLDRGAMAHGVWEDSYVYDIACRVREAIERRTKARVLMTLLVPGLGYKPIDKTALTPNKDAVILTHPWFRQTSSDETKVEVNLRWHLSNQYFERLQKEGVDPQRVVFTSIHADSLHPSLRGTMFYIAGTDYRSERWCSSGESYERFKEVKAKGCYQLTEKQMKRCEGLSNEFARNLEGAFEGGGLTLHPYEPTRDHVVRGRRSWVPAVLRNSIVPCSVLIEVCNLNNGKDAALIADPAFRQKVAEAYVDALIRYYS